VAAADVLGAPSDQITFADEYSADAEILEMFET
jgi:hypothetical protein